MTEREPDPELDKLMSEAFEHDERASISEAAAMLTDSPERQQAERDNELSANAWRKVVAHSEELRKEAHADCHDRSSRPIDRYQFDVEVSQDT